MLCGRKDFRQKLLNDQYQLSFWLADLLGFLTPKFIVEHFTKKFNGDASMINLDVGTQVNLPAKILSEIDF